MNVRASSRFASVLVVASLAPAAGAMELGQPSAPASAAASAITLPVFLDIARLPHLQAAWRARFGSSQATAATPVALVSVDRDAAAINEARQTLTRGEQVSIEATAVRNRAEELSRRFAADPDGSSAPTPDPSPAPVSPEDATVTETAAIEPTSGEAAAAEAAPDAPAQLQKVSATISVPAGGEMAPPSMVGGPRVEEASASEVAPVIEDMATKAPPKAKRSAVNPPARQVAQTAPEPSGSYSIFSSWGASQGQAAPKPDADNSMMPREIRSFGWNAQP